MSILITPSTQFILDFHHGLLGAANSQSYEFQMGNRPVLLVAFRDVGLKGNYSRPDRLWVEGLDLVLDKYAKIAKENPGVPLPPAIAVRRH